MKKFLVTAFLVWSFFLLQTAVCPWFAFSGIKPNLLIILTASVGLMEGEKKAVCGQALPAAFLRICLRQTA